MTETNQNTFGRQPNSSTPAAQTATPPPAARPEALEPERPSPRRSRFSRNRFVVFGHFIISMLVLAAIAAAGMAYFGKMRFDEPASTLEERSFTVNRNEGLTAIANGLADAGLISDDRIFKAGVRASGNAARLKAGEYAIPPQASMREIMDIIVSGRSIQHTVTIPEGLTVLQAWDRIARNDALTGEMPAEMPPEGMMVADTYAFPRGTSRAAVVDHMVEAQRDLVNSIWNGRDADLPLKDMNEFVTLASIVEKETGIAAERPHVAAVFVNRLRQGVKLQSDPTIIYGLFGGAGKPTDRPIYRSDIDKETPYNTYVIGGLPPGPIAIPGKAALEAVAHPLASDDLFFVADGTGGHVFAATLEEHNANVAQWRKIQRDREAEAKAAAEQKPAN